ncbi:MAG: PilC/PilY family type IV pilus protein, partial [bacterium]
GSWVVEKIFEPATDWVQPITSQPRLYWDDGISQMLVLFGTGKYLEKWDRIASTSATQSFYGIKDYGLGSSHYPIELSSGNLLQQTVSTVGSERTLSQNVITTSNEGWYFDFPTTGERVVVRGLLRANAGRIIFSTLIPQGDDPCAPGGTSWLMVVDAASGGLPEGAASLDFNNDGSVDNADALLAGRKLEDVVVGLTPIMPPGGGKSWVLPGGATTTGGGLDPIAALEYPWTRQSWKQLFIH